MQKKIVKPSKAFINDVITKAKAYNSSSSSSSSSSSPSSSPLSSSSSSGSDNSVEIVNLSSSNKTVQTSDSSSSGRRSSSNSSLSGSSSFSSFSHKRFHSSSTPGPVRYTCPAKFKKTSYVLLSLSALPFSELKLIFWYGAVAAGCTFHHEALVMAILIY